MTQPLFTDEGPEYYAAAFAHNRPFATNPPYQTKLEDGEEHAFHIWVMQNKVAFDPNATTVDYDMRGYWKAMLAGQSQAGTEPGGGVGYPDTFKTPYDTTFSAESKYALPNCPFVWQGDNLVDQRNGQLIFSRGAPPTRTAPSGKLGFRHKDGTVTPVNLKVMTGDYGTAIPKLAKVAARCGCQLVRMA